MPTVMTHAVLGLGLGKVFARRRMPLLFWEVTAILSALPDIDVLAGHLGIPYESAFGHRGFTHSLLFALLAGLVAATLFYRRFSVDWRDLLGFFFVVTASHGILDAFTNAGHGVAFFWPIDTTRYFMPLRPIEVSGIGREFFSMWGLRTLLSEILWVWLPAGILVVAVLVFRRFKAPPRTEPPTASGI